jgi:phospholipid/cholesterol/gamma-HCH transport system permease protein
MKEQTKQWTYEAITSLGGAAMLFAETVQSLFSGKANWRDFIYQLYFIGVKSQSVVLITGAFTGMVLCAQTFFQFHKVKMDTASLAVVSVGMCSELGPVLTALMVAGRVGASMAAELGTMRVTEQIDALRTLATHPVDYLVAPRLTATVVAMPFLTAEAIALGIAAAFAVGVGLLGIDGVYAWYHVKKYTGVSDLVIGLSKCLIFGGIIAVVGCYKGMSCREGAEGVGKATTEAVVLASISVLMSNFFLTLVLQQLVLLL